jgi:hypothetical protein
MGISEISSIATLILFGLYFIGRILTMHVERNIRNIRVESYYKDMPFDNYDIVDEEMIDECDYEGIIITPLSDLNYIRIVKCIWNEKKGKLIEGKVIYEYKNLITDYSLLVKIALPCGMPTYKLYFQRCDYMKGEMYIAENGKNGILSEGLKMKHTIKSRIYYIVR